MSISTVLYVCLAVSALPAYPAMNRHQQELSEHYEHLRKIAEFECDAPQKRLLHVNDLFSPFDTHGKAYFPEVTILYRCDRHVGSCNNGFHHCGPTNSQDISLPFKVTFLEEKGGRMKGEWVIEYYSLVNHTSCGCVKTSGVAPPKTAVHIHYVDPNLVSPQSSLPLEPNKTQDKGDNATSYDVPVYNTSTTYGPSINDMVKAAEEQVKPIPSEGNEQNVVKDKDEYIPNNETSDRTPISESSDRSPTASEDNDADRTPTTTLRDSYLPDSENEADTTIPSDFLRFGQESVPKSQALIDSESPYDAYLRLNS